MNRSDYSVDFEWADKVARLSAQPIHLCFQCQRCTSGCLPAADADYTPNRIMRMIQYGYREPVLRSRAIWLCSSCHACNVRCPNGINISEVMDVLKEMAVAEGLAAPRENAPVFHHMFVNGVRRRGRVHESFLMAFYKLRTGIMAGDIPMAFRLFRRGKLPVLSSAVRQKHGMRRIFRLTGRSVAEGRSD